MKVRALQIGYYDHRRRYVGEEFEMGDDRLRKDKATGKVLEHPDGTLIGAKWCEAASRPARIVPEENSGPRTPQTLKEAAKGASVI